MTPKEQHYIASTDIDADPHVTAQWEGENLTVVSVSHLTAGELTWEEFRSAWKTAQELRASREKCR